MGNLHNLFLIFLEAEKFKIKVLPGPFCERTMAQAVTSEPCNVKEGKNKTRDKEVFQARAESKACFLIELLTCPP